MITGLSMAGGYLHAILYLPVHYLLELVYFIFRCRPQKEIVNQHILITGAAQGIGAEFALQFAEMGNTVHCVDLNSKMIQEKVEELKSKGHKAVAYTCDLTNADQVTGLYEEITAAGHSITVLVNNAGVAFGADVTTMSLNQIQHSINVNLVSNLWLIKLFLPKMVEMDTGHVVNIASLAGFFALTNSTDYCAAKAGSIHTMTQLRLQTAGSNLKFTVVCPFFVATKMITGLDHGKVHAILPKDLVAGAIKGVRENKEVVIIPRIFHLIRLITSIIPKSIGDVYLAKTKVKSLDAGTFIGQQMKDKIK